MRQPVAVLFTKSFHIKTENIGCRNSTCAYHCLALGVTKTFSSMNQVKGLVYFIASMIQYIR